MRSRFAHSLALPGSLVADESPAAASAANEGDAAEIGRIFREESGRAVATLIRLLGDIDLAEDAVQDAFAIAPTDRAVVEEVGAVQDDRLRLIFTCCHPALGPDIQVALTLRLLGGLSTDEVAA